MVSVQIIDISTFPHNDTHLDLSMHKLKGFQYMNDTIKTYNQKALAALFAGNRHYFINKIDNVNHKELLQLCHRIPSNADITALNLSRNYIIYFPHQLVPRNIATLNLSKNLIRETGPLAQHLTTLKYNHNPLTVLPIEIPPGLRKLSISGTNITELPNLPVTLEQLSIRHTRLRQLPANFMQLNRLNNFKMDGNPNLVITEAELAFIDIVFERRRAMQPVAPPPQLFNYGGGDDLEGPRDVYGDGQNVHDSTVNNDVMKGVLYLLAKCGKAEQHKGCIHTDMRKMINSLRNKEVMDYLMTDVGDSKFGEIRCDLIYQAYFNHLLSFTEEVRAEILKMLDGDLPEMRYVCTTGRIARLINTLVGFDPNVEVKIADNAQIQAKFNLVNKRYADISAAVARTILQAWLFYNLMQEIAVKAVVVQIWLDPFIEVMVDEHIEFIVKLIEGTIETDDGKQVETVIRTNLANNTDNCFTWLKATILADILRKETAGDCPNHLLLLKARLV